MLMYSPVTISVCWDLQTSPPNRDYRRIFHWSWNLPAETSWKLG